jgi:hypothetical protein
MTSWHREQRIERAPCSVDEFGRHPTMLQLQDGIEFKECNLRYLQVVDEW